MTIDSSEHPREGLGVLRAPFRRGSDPECEMCQCRWAPDAAHSPPQARPESAMCKLCAGFD